MLLGIAVFVSHRRRTLVDLEMEGGLHSRVMNNLDTDTADDNLMPCPADNIQARQEVLSGSNSTLGAVDYGQSAR